MSRHYDIEQDEIGPAPTDGILRRRSVARLVGVEPVLRQVPPHQHPHDLVVVHDEDARPGGLRPVRWRAEPTMGCIEGLDRMLASGPDGSVGASAHSDERAMAIATFWHHCTLGRSNQRAADASPTFGQQAQATADLTVRCNRIPPTPSLCDSLKRHDW